MKKQHVFGTLLRGIITFFLCNFIFSLQPESGILKIKPDVCNCFAVICISLIAFIIIGFVENYHSQNNGGKPFYMSIIDLLTGTCIAISLFCCGHRFSTFAMLFIVFFSVSISFNYDAK